MANPLPNEAALYQRIKQEKITVDPVIWDAMYHYLGDYLSVINVLVSFYIEQNAGIPIDDARKILGYNHKIKLIVDQVLKPATINQEESPMGKIKEANVSLHPLVKDFFMHYIANDTYIINLCVSYYLDPIDEKPVPVEDAKKILAHAQSMASFLNKLREATRF